MLVYIWVTGMALRGWVDGGIVSLLVLGLVSAGGVFLVRAAWNETLILTEDTIIVENLASRRREVPLSQVEQATARLRGVHVRLRGGERLIASAVVRLAVNPWRRRPRPSEEVAQLINEAVARHELRRRLLDGMVAVQRVRSGR
ncbi:hypothetical protein Cci01nite_15250 [Catellatospora citrea]|uniref:Uncharacterized protein n=1 Tax=Catellatospora citrea TaxID=53366 RepID=A0A8J3NY65_9ACTN|nr:hypothetical protein C8E86_5895 [Catellatospora citrea]GIF96431.1 hypothetical protein Cci01nite_15250 [Catellatospora citrea]